MDSRFNLQDRENRNNAKFLLRDFCNAEESKFHGADRKAEKGHALHLYNILKKLGLFKTIETLIADIDGDSELYGDMRICLEEHEGAIYTLAQNEDYFELLKNMGRNMIAMDGRYVSTKKEDVCHKSIQIKEMKEKLKQSDVGYSFTSQRLYEMLLHLFLSSIIVIESDELLYEDFIKYLNIALNSPGKEYYEDDPTSKQAYNLYIIGIIYSHWKASTCDGLPDISHFRINKLDSSMSSYILGAINAVKKVETYFQKMSNEFRSEANLRQTKIMKEVAKTKSQFISIISLLMAAFTVIVSSVFVYRLSFGVREIAMVNISLIAVLSLVFALVAIVTYGYDEKGNWPRFWVPFISFLVSAVLLIVLVYCWPQDQATTNLNRSDQEQKNDSCNRADRPYNRRARNRTGSSTRTNQHQRSNARNFRSGSNNRNSESYEYESPIITYLPELPIEGYILLSDWIQKTSDMLYINSSILFLENWISYPPPRSDLDCDDLPDYLQTTHFCPYRSTMLFLCNYMALVA